MLYLLLFGAVTVIAAYLVLHDWGITRLHWRYFTTDSCRRYLKANGWKIIAPGEILYADKGQYRIMIECIDVEVATIPGMVSGVQTQATDGRQYLVLVPGTIMPGVVDEMLTREISVIALSQLGSLDAILDSHKARVEGVRAYKKRLSEAGQNA
jgi:hypothetical protein